MAQQADLVVTVCMRWWVPVCVRALRLFYFVTGCDPDLDKIVAFIIRRGFRFRVGNRWI